MKAKLVRFKNGKYGARVWDWRLMSHTYLGKDGYAWMSRELIPYSCHCDTKKEAQRRVDNHNKPTVFDKGSLLCDQFEDKLK